MTKETETVERLTVENDALRKRVAELEETVRQRDRVMQTVIDHIPALIFVMDLEDTYSHTNQSCAIFMGRKEVSEIVGHNAREFFPPEVFDSWRENNRLVAAKGEAIVAEESGPREDGIHFYQSIKFPVRDSEGTIRWIGGIATNVTAERRADARLRESQAHAQAMLDASTDLLLLVDLEGVVVVANQAAAGRLGCTPAEVAGMRDVFPLDEPARRASLVEEIRRTGTPAHFDAARDDRWFEVTAYPVQSGDGPLARLAIYGRDVTEQRRAAQEQRRLQEQVIEAQRLAIQEIGTPLVPLTNAAVAIPLIGAIDEVRAAHFVETMLRGVEERGAHIVVVDVTGVNTVDTHVAEVLVRAARAAKLLGAEVIMTGIRPAVAQALVELGADLGGVVTLASLQDGIAYAVRGKGRASSPRRGVSS
ncbi:PAS domain-containing protein [Polyangium jinanense]|uniref:PAS domain-containing protein n=1 Tax=Polyangium jinanense TaxID=2829994 RepID=A0A9X3X0L3_9BACT|nr:PAS domain-containing protein [Polyangium jinanense]MDC3955181.1 PAS domain-containing protein [Polyangium jinanense]MDC3981482.1 PAS domain-containing protein [Polyangium jinanense]